MRDLSYELHAGIASGLFSLPFPGKGNTAARHRALFEFGRRDLSFARLAEAHTDALAILEEAGRTAASASLYGVWASENPKAPLQLTASGSSSWLLNGSKRYCSGAPMLDAALVSAQLGTESVLIEVPLSAEGIAIQPGDWATPAFADTHTSTVHFQHVELSSAAIIGPPSWYLDREGFWHGAIGPAACWAGGAAGLVDAACALGKADPHSRAQLGALEADTWGMHALLAQAGREIDDDPSCSKSEGRLRALKVRHLIERLCTDVLDRFGRATGPQLLAFDAPIALRHAELSLYIRQCHGERDLESIPK